MRIIDGRILFGETITIEKANGDIITRKIQTTNKDCPCKSTLFVNVDGKKLKANDIERAEVTDLNETEQKMMAELQRAYDSMVSAQSRGYRPSNGREDYYSFSVFFVQNVIGHDIVIRDGKVTAIVG